MEVKKRRKETAGSGRPFVRPEILAPAGNRASFLAALAAEADAVYCGLTEFSARMAAKNFSLKELASLTHLAHSRGTRVYVAVNTMIKPDELEDVGELVGKLEKQVHPDALIIQDLSLLSLAKQAGFTGELHLSTLANVSFPKGVALAGSLPSVHRIVIPRELTIDDIRKMADACPPSVGLEVFVHGALCYGVSGRCYWSSYMGGKSGLRGRCVQPCRRIYQQQDRRERFFSCQDFSLDVLVKVLLTVPAIRAWKIEGRKKGPHYVYHTVSAYRLLRDAGSDPAGWADAKKEAISLLSRSLGRTGTHYHFLTHRPQNPIPAGGQTGSGLLVGRIKGRQQQPYFNSRESLISGDVLRIGYEDEPWHQVIRVGKPVPLKGRMQIGVRKGRGPAKGSPVFLTDRRDPMLAEMISDLAGELAALGEPSTGSDAVSIALPKRSRKRKMPLLQRVWRHSRRVSPRDATGLWLSKDTCRSLSKQSMQQLWWWLPPVIWPEDEPDVCGLIEKVLAEGGRRFVLNAPWQMRLFRRLEGLNLWAGPFCNVANGLAVHMMQSFGFEGVIISPELNRADVLSLPGQSPLPLGIVISGNWPLCISRIISNEIQTEQAFSSPKHERSWVKKIGADYWVYPDWELDLKAHQGILQQAGYSLFVHLSEPVPKQIRLKKRPGRWNWDLKLQ